MASSQCVGLHSPVPSCEQRFPPCMAFSINEVIPMACRCSQVTYKEETQILLKPLNVFQVNNCIVEWRWAPRMSRGFHLWHSQPLDRVTPPWLANPCPPAMSPHANGTRHPSHWFNSGRIKGGRDKGKRMIQRLNEENGRHKNTVLSTWSWCKQGWQRLSQTTDPRPRSLLLTLLNKNLFNLI